MTDHSTIIILGASGNLACTKLFPALYALFKQGKLTHFAIIGAAAQNITINDLCARIKENIAHSDEHTFEQFKSRLTYITVDFSKPEDFAQLHAHVKTIEQSYHLANSNRLVYCAVAADYFEIITEQCAQHNILERTTSTGPRWHRIIYEKPFGHDAASAHAINTTISRYFDEHQVYRIDHYLTKELVSNIALLRFTNCILEPLWNNRYIDNIQIILSETIGVQERGMYYDAYGALKDMVQNHILELVALIGMESPEKLTGDHIREQRARVLKNVHITDGIRGQYEGYLQEPHIKPHSPTETFAELIATIDNARWAGVPFYLKTGKCLNKKESVIHIKFKQVDCLLTKNCPSDSNYLIIRISPEASISLFINAKKPGQSHHVEQISMEFPHHARFGAQTPEAYEVIFQEVINGEQSIAVRFDEIESAWHIIDNVEHMRLPLYRYQQGSKGPNEVHNFETKHGIRWQS